MYYLNRQRSPELGRMVVPGLLGTGQPERALKPRARVSIFHISAWIHRLLFFPIGLVELDALGLT